MYIYIDSYTNWVGWCWLFFVVASWDPSSFFLAFSQIPNRQKTQAVKFYPEDQATTSGALSFLFGKVVPKLKCTGWWKCKKKKESVEGMTIFHKRTLFQHLCDEGFFRSRQLQVKTCERLKGIRGILDCVCKVVSYQMEETSQTTSLTTNPIWTP